MPRRRPLAQINVIPYIDVMLVLLVSLVITAPLLKTGVEVDLPQAAAQPLMTPTPPQTLVVTVAANGAWTLADGQPLTRGQLEAATRSALTADPTTAVFVRGDRAVAYGKVIEVMVILQQAGVERIGLITDPAVKD